MIDIEQLLSPKITDIEYSQDEMLKISLICRMDSYKFSHPYAYRKGIKAMSSYGEARVSGKIKIVNAGGQLVVKRYLSQQITMADVDRAEAFSEKHFGRKLFKRASWVKVVREYNGFLPLIVRALREGTVVSGGVPLYSITAIGEDYFWMSSAFETLLQRAIWYPTTIASMDYEIKTVMKKFYIDTGADLAMLPFGLHDFGARGVTVGEQAESGGCFHTFNFQGSDNIEGILTANYFYKCEMAAFSVYATEHSVECSFGLGSDEEIEYIRHQLRTAKELGLSVVSIVIDGKDVYRATNVICTVLRDEIIASGVKVVLRPDSGDMMIVVPKLIQMLDKAFGHTVNAKGFKKLRYVGILQGDGVDHLAIKSLLGHLMSYGWAADNVIFGSGGALLQKVNRDTFKFAQKGSAILVEIDGVLIWIGIAKDPVTDPGKKSKEGVMTALCNTVTGEYIAGRLDQDLPEGYEDAHILIYHTGRLFNETTLDEVRVRCAV